MSSSAPIRATGDKPRRDTCRSKRPWVSPMDAKTQGIAAGPGWEGRDSNRMAARIFRLLRNWLLSLWFCPHCDTLNELETKQLRTEKEELLLKQKEKHQQLSKQQQNLYKKDLSKRPFKKRKQNSSSSDQLLKA